MCWSRTTRPGTFGKHDGAIGKKRRLGGRMRDEDDGDSRCQPQIAKLLVKPLAGDLVECREWFVHQEEFGVGDHRPREGDPHSHSARKLIRIAIGSIRQTDAFDGR